MPAAFATRPGNRYQVGEEGEEMCLGPENRKTILILARSLQ
jgi:hypothetical protein